MFDLPPPRHISTLRRAADTVRSGEWLKLPLSGPTRQPRRLAESWVESGPPPHAASYSIVILVHATIIRCPFADALAAALPAPFAATVVAILLAAALGQGPRHHRRGPKRSFTSLQPS